jgi:hypothetical protein
MLRGRVSAAVRPVLPVVACVEMPKSTPDAPPLPALPRNADALAIDLSRYAGPRAAAMACKQVGG